MEPHLSKNDIPMFHKYLDKAEVYFEYGSGGSTYQASMKNNIKKIYSVESDKEWQNKLMKFNNNKITFLYNEMDTRPNTWGGPGENATNIQKINYSDKIRTLNDEEKSKINLVLIDGRFRVACCLKCFDVVKDDCFIAFDDFFNRPHYHIVLNYFDLVEKTSDNIMAILRKKKNVSIPQDLVEKYELIKD